MSSEINVALLYYLCQIVFTKGHEEPNGPMVTELGVFVWTKCMDIIWIRTFDPINKSEPCTTVNPVIVYV